MNSQIREAAAHWLVEFHNDTPDVATRRQFAAWLRTSPEHISAYLNAVALWESAQHYDPQRRLDTNGLVARAHADSTITDLRAEYCSDGAADAPVPESRGSRASLSRKTVLRRLLRPRTAVAVFLSLVVNCLAIWIAMDSRNVAHTTQIAEQSSVVLTDGSRVDLDALSSLRVSFTSHERTVELLSGQALFRVTKDATRPFVVRVGDERYRAVGTQFDMNRTTIGTVLTVVEGRVAVLPASGIGAKVDAGQQMTILNNRITVPQAVDTAAVTGWTRRLLVFTSTPLAVAAEEFNRFNVRRLVIASPELVDFKVTGTYAAFDPDALADFVRFLRQQPGIEVLEKDDQIAVQTHSNPLPSLWLHK